MYFCIKSSIGIRVKLASCKSALTPTVVYSTDRSKAVVPMLVLLCVALFILRGDLLYVLPCVILFLCFSVLLALRLPRLGKRELILVLFVRLFDLCLFGFVCFLILGVWEGLRFGIVALPGLFCYLLFHIIRFLLSVPHLSILLLVPRDSCAWIWHFLGILTYHCTCMIYHDKVANPARNKRTFVNWSCTEI